MFNLFSRLALVFSVFLVWGVSAYAASVPMAAVVAPSEKAVTPGHSQAESAPSAFIQLEEKNKKLGIAGAKRLLILQRAAQKDAVKTNEDCSRSLFFILAASIIPLFVLLGWYQSCPNKQAK
jgi:hypothetical protein